MQAWRVQGGFGLDHLELVDLDEPEGPGPGEVRLQMRAWSLNYRDQLMIGGSYDPRLAFPWIPLSDGVGEVIAVGEGVERISVGDRVCPTFSPSWIAGPPDPEAVRRTRGGPIPGVLAQILVLPADEVVAVPAHLTDVEAATLPCAALTAWSALEGCQPGETVLVLGSGGVSVWALQLAQRFGARVVATTSTHEKAEQLVALGADEVILRRSDPRWGQTVRRWSGGGVDRVIEVGGAGTLAQSLDAVRVGGTVALIGVVAGAQQPLSVLPILMKQIRCQGIFVGSRHGLEALCRALVVHPLRPVVDRIFPLGALPEALSALASGQHVGKICLEA
ncbi:MAG TPA: NAD(P)-dependent alcohol dehydrogenase [Deltaproteobacteria bacterium]|nr:NAD(P)-dependent alcohol dehydrogenase [Deltaproteobacteria bacterium]